VSLLLSLGSPGCPGPQMSSLGSPTILPLPVDPQWALGRVVGRHAELQRRHTWKILVVCNTQGYTCDLAQDLYTPAPLTCLPHSPALKQALYSCRVPQRCAAGEGMPCVDGSPRVLPKATPGL
jgi:hypothetical protein